eukprot:TRINITY_DN1409_c0_g1_i1.p1 TRINITY_DN1409_c0_g1~~TRINITY_DN1409_c0_g1_i1.p1  ORF type:complete len:157 (-),score=21.51 TRINITY_DN1409_c0_g1_i1:35-505(-)
MDGFKRLIGVEEKEPTLMDQINDQFSLSIRQRAIGFVVCCGLGLLLDFLGFLFFLSPTTFALFYTLGNILAIVSTGFVVGPFKQLKNMMKPTRIFCALVFVSSMVLTLVAVFKGWPVIVVIIFIIFQFCALLYYCFSYIPYGRQCLRGICGNLVAV